jgi:hypothetical protein
MCLPELARYQFPSPPVHAGLFSFPTFNRVCLPFP